uniref:Dolichyl-diphosphooligosaccharide--protein glycosyltransferase subunit 2 n=1 Tax=Meloidogyne floridensis TaxID=298350 RepID=A0A915NJU8_9BILA
MKFNYEKLPEIQHQFQVSDSRPPVIVSDVFSAICFHTGLSAIFGLYASHWLRSDTDMFETLKWLALIGSLTLFCGNRLLKR